MLPSSGPANGPRPWGGGLGQCWCEASGPPFQGPADGPRPHGGCVYFTKC